MFHQPATFSQMKVNLAPPLYIGDLEPQMTEELLYSYFSKFGPLFVVKITRDPNTNQSKGYGFITFINLKDAEQARALSNYEKILGASWPIRVMWKRRPQEFINPKANVYVSNLDLNAGPRDLENALSKAGPITSVKIAHTRSVPSQSLGYGYVQYETAESAEKAIAELNGTRIKEKEVVVGRFVPRTERPQTKKNIFLKNLPRLPKGSDEQVKQLITKVYSAFGEITSLAVKYDDNHQGYIAFVNFKNEEDASKAFEASNNSDLFASAVPVDQVNPTPLYASWFINRAHRYAEISRQFANAKNETNIYMRGLKIDVTVDRVKAVFGVFGRIIDACVKESEPVNKAKYEKMKFSCVAYERPEEAQDALSKAATTPEVRDLFADPNNIYIRLHESKEKRREYVKTLQRRPMMYFFNQPPSMFFPPGYGPLPPMARPPFRYPPMPMMGEPPGVGGLMGPPQIPPFMRPPYRPYHNQGGNFRRPYDRHPQHFQNRGPGGRGNQQYRPRGRPQYQNNRGGYNQGGYNQGGYNNNPRRTYSGPAQVRSPQMQSQSQTPQVAPVQAPARTVFNAANLRENLPEFLKLPKEDQRTFLGEMLFPRISHFVGDPELAPKITGMLVDFEVMEVPEIIELLENQDALIERIKEAEDLILGRASE